MKKHPVYLIAAADDKGGIGKNGKLPWTLPQDLAFFQRTTTKTEKMTLQNMVVMGRKTWESIPEACRPLPGRRNVVLSRHADFKADGAYVFSSFRDALESADDFIESVFVIGGGTVFQEAVRARNLKGIYLTRIKGDFKCDTFFPRLPRGLVPQSIGKGEEKGLKFEFLFYKVS